MQVPISRSNNMKSVGWMRPESRNSVSVIAAVVAIIPFERNDVPILVPAAVGIDDQVNTDSECWPPARDSSKVTVFLYLCCT